MAKKKYSNGISEAEMLSALVETDLFVERLNAITEMDDFIVCSSARVDGVWIITTKSFSYILIYNKHSTPESRLAVTQKICLIW